MMDNKQIQDIIAEGDFKINEAIRYTVNKIINNAATYNNYVACFEDWLYATHGDGHRLKKGYGYSSKRTVLEGSYFTVVRFDYEVEFNDEPTGERKFSLAVNFDDGSYIYNPTGESI